MFLGRWGMTTLRAVLPNGRSSLTDMIASIVVWSARFVSFALTSWGLTIRDAAQDWVNTDSSASVTGVHWVGVNATIDVVTDDGEIPDTADLATAAMCS